MANIISKLAAETHNEFMRLIQWSDYEGRDLPIEGEWSNKEKGHLMNLKKAGLVSTYVCNGDPEMTLWLTFTDQGRDYAQKHTPNISTCGTCGRKVRDLEDRIDIEWYSDTECGPCGRERIRDQG